MFYINRNFIPKSYLWILGFLKPYISKYILFCIFGIVITSIELITPKFVQQFIDVILPKKNISLFLFSISILVIAIILKIFLEYYKNIGGLKIQEKASKDLQTSVFKHLRNLGYAYFENNSMGNSLAFLGSEVKAAQEIYTRFVPQIIDGIVFSLISMLFMFFLSDFLFYLTILSFFLYYCVGPFFEKKAAYYGKKYSVDNLQHEQKIYEMVSALSESRGNSINIWNKNRLLEVIKISNESMIKTFSYQFLRGSIRRLSYYIGALLIILVGANFVRNNEITIGEMVAFILYYFTTMQILTNLITLLTDQKIYIYRLKKLFEFKSLEPVVKEVENPVFLPKVVGEIEFNNVSFSYPDGRKAINEISIHISPGEKIGIVGSSGSGKTTFLKLLSRFYDVSEGKITLDGIPIKELSLFQLRDSIGYAFQETFLFNLSIMENIRFGNPSADDSEVIEAAKIACAHSFIKKLPKGYDTVVGEKGMKLSGGEKQKISIARIVLKNPKIILLDEATASLDNISEDELKNSLIKYFENKLIITIAHRLSTLKNYDRLMLIENGEIKKIGTFEQLFGDKQSKVLETH